ncbi:MAG: ABC transporter ATP-binding protein [Candidatus Peribacteraceae bacterium]|nr:ABC transporter ATP-binding protein [Candidatus Peribacteraceae bacterium]
MSSATTHGQVLRFVWKHARGNRLKLLGIFLLIVAAAALSLSQPLFFRAAIDTIAKSSTDDAFRYARFMFLSGTAIIGLAMSCEQLGFWLLGQVEPDVMKGVHDEAFAKTQLLSTDFHVNEFAGSTARKITRGVDAVEQVLDKIVMTFLPALAISVGFMVALGAYSLLIAAWVLVGIIAYCVVSIGSNLYLMKFSKWVDEQDSRVTGNLVDTITANTVVKSFAGEHRENHRHTALLLEWNRRQKKTWALSTFFSVVQYALLLIVEIGILLISLDLWRRGVFTAGSFVVIIVYIWQLWSKLWDIGRSVRYYMQAISRIGDTLRIIQQPLAVEDATKAKALKVSKGTIDFKNISFQYANLERSIFENFSLSINSGETIALVGHSGGGKSTIVKLLLRLYDVQRGSITIDDQNIAHVTQESLRRAIGLVPQEPILFHRSIAENISYGKPHATKKQIEEAARKAHAHEFIELLPKGYDTHVGERGVKLSGGERQRVALARTILADAPILVLDEATSSLDSVSEKYIQDALEYLMKDRTTIVIAHRLSTIKRANRIIVLSEGKIAEIGSHEELLTKKNGIYKHLYELQAGGFLGEE